jgi:hypothetical protein
MFGLLRGGKKNASQEVDGTSGAANSSAAGLYSSHASAALAAAAAADGAPRASRRPAAGRAVSGAVVVVRVDELRPGEAGEIPVGSRFL